MNDTGFPSGSWRKSSYSGNSGNCVEVATTLAAVGLRDTKDRDGGVLTLGPEAWAQLLTASRG